ncbi:MAG: nucleotidyltransferase domain-containing protein [Candidatus Woesearchaeota archaeon]
MVKRLIKNNVEKLKAEQKNAQLSRKMLNAVDIIALFTGDLDSSIHGRQMQRMLNIPQRTVVDKLKNLSESNVLKNRKKGAQKEYFLDKNNPAVMSLLIIAEEYKSVVFLSSDFKLGELFLKLRLNVNGSIIVFGSYARNDQDKGSDLDILILGKFDKKMIERIIGMYPIKVHTVGMPFSDFEAGLFKKENFMLEVLKNHVIIKGTSDIIDLFWRFYYG